MKRWQPWTAEQLRLLDLHYPLQTAKALVAIVGHTPTSIYQQAAKRGLTKAPEFHSSRNSGRLDGIRGTSTRFQQGHSPWNKGMKGLDIGGKETRFKRGQAPHNTKPVGDYRINRDGMLQRKIGTAKGSNSKRWRGVHELVWIEANGPVPAGHICIFKPGMRTTVLEEITADKVECITFAENMRRNSYHTNYPKEVGLAIQMRGALNRKINHLTRKDDDEQRDHH